MIIQQNCIKSLIQKFQNWKQQSKAKPANAN
jgi:hypothetical protein